LAVWIGGVGLALAAPIFSLLIGSDQPTEGSPLTITALLIPAAMMVFGYAITLIGFKIESSKAKTFFYQLFEADKVEEASLQEILWAT
jgi:hypothetical protein